MFSRSSPVSPTLLERATRQLHHRGPDGQRHWISSDGLVGLGHARLSIIDLTTGDQPIASEDGHKHIIVNGEFYDYEATQRKLEHTGHHLRTRSDSEIALHLYEDLGVQCLHRLRGEFAFVLWDENHRTLFAARDRFGIKPLFYAIHGETLYLASEVKALFEAGVPARWDAESVAQATEFGSHQVRTLFDGIFQVPPGHYLIATDRHIQLNSIGTSTIRQEIAPHYTGLAQSMRRNSVTFCKKRFAFACVLMFRSVAISAGDSTLAPCWALRQDTAQIPFAPSR